MMTVMRYLPLLLVLAACGASATPLEVASTTIDASRAALPSVCPHSSPACDAAVASLNIVIDGYNVALDAHDKGAGSAVTEQAVSDAAVSVLRLIQTLTAKTAVDGGAK